MNKTDKARKGRASKLGRPYSAIERAGYEEASEQFKAHGCFSSGRTWENDDEANEAYDRGVNRAEAEHTSNGNYKAHADKLAEEAEDTLRQFHLYLNDEDCELPDLSGLESALNDWRKAKNE